MAKRGSIDEMCGQIARALTMAWIDDTAHGGGYPLSPTHSSPSQLTFYEFGVTYREAELAAERRRYQSRRSKMVTTQSKDIMGAREE